MQDEAVTVTTIRHTEPVSELISLSGFSFSSVVFSVVAADFFKHCQQCITQGRGTYTNDSVEKNCIFAMPTIIFLLKIHMR